MLVCTPSVGIFSYFLSVYKMGACCSALDGGCRGRSRISCWLVGAARETDDVEWGSLHRGQNGLLTRRMTKKQRQQQQQTQFIRAACRRVCAKYTNTAVFLSCQRVSLRVRKAYVKNRTQDSLMAVARAEGSVSSSPSWTQPFRKRSSAHKSVCGGQERKQKKTFSSTS